MFTGTGNFADKVDGVFLFLLIVSIVFLVLITGLMIYFVIKYSAKRNPNPEDIHGNAFLEILWTAVPTLLVLAMFYYGWIHYKYIREVPEGALEIGVTGQMWSWVYDYENGARTDTLYVPVNQDIKLNLSSNDVLHSFFIPAFRLKFDVVPGSEQYMWFRPDEPGVYDVLCAEYCGLQHSYMLSSLKVLPESEYEAWYSSSGEMTTMAESKDNQTNPGDAGTMGNAIRGGNLVKVTGCLACHSTDGTRLISKSFKGLYGRETTVMTDGKERNLTVNEEYIRRSILNPSFDIVKGFQNLMPSQQGNLSDEDIKDIIAYLRGLK